ncbi:pentapeptide repeat-containing protein [Streptomyces sp. RLB3-17]|nr:pentapeptide repeat-containing protein [Streptomyces sp. S1D4-20]QDN73231.1 pentapeptide repeat-containing protein [Streptomyces sp. S1D4-14]QDN83327.1 pentapeptide repeat-containing protein [Streptomyces sp. S1A1-7]QDO03909.1 pentapeptide repeat-containing protein [Streptomyces sp. RLB1-9]QDO25700.1 pentapeptide repeat-containing protein [Streptomyces sp. S1A1-8]QDO35817.1 pentapeptide repeat-containing protein [Streptomyces sp. S1A1-3]QDO45863.1 pentapeptide repeat-containing protein [St
MQAAHVCPHDPEVASLLRRRRTPLGRHTPNLWPVWIVAPLALVVVGTLSVGLYHGVYGLLADATHNENPRKPVNVSDVIKTTVTALTLVGAVLAGIYAYRKQLLAEGDAHRTDANQLADRYTTAAEQLGHNQAAVRLAGVYALARLADDWQEQRQVCIDVLCAYLRMPYEPELSAPGYKEGEREVRLTIIDVIHLHLLNPETPTSWCENRFNFNGATFDGGDFFGSHFCNFVYFGEATFSNGMVSFRRAKFKWGYVAFRDATFSGGHVDFREAAFSGATVDFDRATFSGSMVTFGNSTFSGGTVDFDGSTFSGGTVNFDGSTFSGSTIDWGPFPRPAGA